MSAYIKLLLLNRDEIKTSIVQQVDDVVYFNFDSDLYDDLMALETKIETLYKAGLITDEEILILNLITLNKSFRSLEKIYGISRITISKKFDSICNKLALYLGGKFTNEGYARYLMRKYNLTEAEFRKLIQTFNKELSSDITL
jgi:hypothetical protein